MLKETTENAAIFQSGIVTDDAHISSSLSGGGRLFNHPEWDDLSDDNEAVVATDDPSDEITPDKIGSRKSQFIRFNRAKAWSSANLTKELAGDDPQKRIASRVGAWWARSMDRAAVSHLNGVLNSNVANNSGDMVHDISSETGTIVVGGQTVNAFNLSADAVIEGKQTMGDSAESLKLIVMHSRLFSNLQLQNLIAFIPNSQGVVNIPTYMNYQVLVTDNVPVEVSGSDFLYTTYLVGEGVLAHGESPVDLPVETDRKPGQGNGQGVETLYTRRQFSFWPKGWNWTDASCALQSPTNAEVENAANWSRSWPEREMFNMAAIISKNG